MPYVFERNPASSFKFRTSTATATETTTLNGINATVDSANVICEGVTSLMAIGGYTPGFYEATRTNKDTVVEEEG